MLTVPTLDRLRALRLGAMADAYRAQQQDLAIGSLSFDERIGLLVGAEHLSRDNRKLPVDSRTPSSGFRRRVSRTSTTRPVANSIGR